MDKNMDFFCNGKKGFCDFPYLCADCVYFDNSGGDCQENEKEDSED